MKKKLLQLDMQSQQNIALTKRGEKNNKTKIENFILLKIFNRQTLFSKYNM